MTTEIRIADIDDHGDRARAFDPVWAEALARMIEVQGLLQPILVRASPDGRYVLVAGLHRLRAFALLGRESIPIRLSQAETDDQARLDEVMENLGRYDLTALDRCRHLWELKSVWQMLHPEVRHGGDRRSAIKAQTLRFGPVRPEVFNFTRDVAEKIGLSARAIEMAVRIWHYLSPESRRRLVGTDLARKQTELKALSEQKPAVQVKILDLILGDAAPENVAQALDYLEHGVTPNALEKRFATFSKSFASLPDAQFDFLLSAHEARVIESLRRRGRI